MELRGVMFSSADFDGFEPDEGTPSERLATFALNGRELCACTLEFDMPIPIVESGRTINGTLAVTLTHGRPKANGAINHIHLSITLSYNGRTFTSDTKTGHFEDGLNRIQNQLPNGTHIKACITCLYSDYSPFGSGLFGTMMCFRNVKDDYLAVISKDTFWDVHDHYDRQVQETYLCDDFKRRVAGTGYRG